MFRKDYCRSGAIYRRRRAGVHSPASFIGFFSVGGFISTAGFSSTADSPSACLADSRISEMASINLIAIKSMGTPKIKTAKMSNRRIEPAVCIIAWAGALKRKRWRGKTTPLPRIPIKSELVNTLE